MSNLKKNADVMNAIENERVFRAVVTRVTENEETGKLCIPLNVPIAVGDKLSLPGVIHEDEIAKVLPRTRRLNHLIGLEIPFVVTGIGEDGETLLCSRRRAQEILMERMMPDLENGEKVYTGRITRLTSRGAFVVVDGIEGFLSDADYADDHSRIRSRYRDADAITVRCKSVDVGGRIAWEAAPKYRRDTPFICDLSPGDLVLGDVVGVRNFDDGPAVFVRVKGQKEEFDVLCSMPAELEIERNVPVAVRVKSVRMNDDPMQPPRLRGVILHLA